MLICSAFGNKIPREGTETLFCAVIIPKNRYDLEIRYPERGRKHQYLSSTNDFHLARLFGNKIPREGTETVVYRASSCFHNYLEIRYPERGRKHSDLNGIN